MDGSIPGQKSSTGALLNLSGNAQVFIAAIAEDLVPFDSPTFTGAPVATTAAPGDSSQRIATTAFVSAAIGAVGAGNVSNSGTPAALELAEWVTPTTIKGITKASLGFAPLASPVFTGDPQAPTPLSTDNDTSIATTAFVKTVVAAGYLPLSGGTLTGDLTIDKNSPNLFLTKAAGGGASILGVAKIGGFVRWALTLGDSTAEGGAGSNTGSNFSLNRFNDAGSYLGSPIQIDRATGQITLGVTVLGGGSTVPTPSAGDASNKIATTGFVNAAIKPPTRILLTTSGSYGPSSGCRWFEIEMVGGGGGGANGGGTAGVDGGSTSFGGFTAGGGSGSGAAGSYSGSFGAGDLVMPGGVSGNHGNVGDNVTNVSGSPGADSMFGRGGPSYYSAGGGNATGYGAGGGGGGRNVGSPATGGNGGGSGGYVRKIFPSPTGSYAYSVGSGGGGAGTVGNGLFGGSGTNGIIMITEHY